ncbi:MAG: hypothetical protein F2837_07940 [Actinobacteria bacterium]|nr:hypothetical protein [Actinomycetota bacterium]
MICSVGVVVVVGSGPVSETTKVCGDAPLDPTPAHHAADTQEADWSRSPVPGVVGFDTADQALPSHT